jgi:hypothetical protein
LILTLSYAVRVVKSDERKGRETPRLDDEAIAASLDGTDRVVVSTKMLRAELLSVKADLGRELECEVLDYAVCGKRVHYVGGLGARDGHLAHAEPAPHATPKLAR